MAMTLVRNGRNARNIGFKWLEAIQWCSLWSAASTPAISNGATNGRLQAGDTYYKIAGKTYLKSGTDNLWNLSGQTTLSTGQYKAVALYLDVSGTASIGAGTVKTTAAAALQALPAPPVDKSTIGVFVAGPSTNFGNALSGQGTIHNGLPTDAFDLDGSGGTGPLTFTA